MELKLLNSLSPLEYEHPFDAKALNSLQNTAGLDRLVQKFYDLGIERIIKLQYTGGAIKVTPNNMSDLCYLAEEACAILNMPDVPQMYIYGSPELHAVTLGVENPLIVLPSEAVERLSDEELLFIIGREIGHIKSRHILYQEIGLILPEMAEAFSAATFGLGGLISIGLRYAMMYWMQMSQYTADRAGLLACQNIETVTKVLAKSAGLPKKYEASYNLDDFVTQAREFQGFNEKTFDKVLRFLFKNHLWAVARANELFKWTDAGDYRSVLERNTLQLVQAKPIVKFCTNCGAKQEVGARFCHNCGAPQT